MTTSRPAGTPADRAPSATVSETSSFGAKSCGLAILHSSSTRSFSACSALGPISGAHFNAAVTFAFALTRHFPWPRAAAYWSAQFVGAVCAAALLRGSLGNIAQVGATIPSGSSGQSRSKK